MECAANGLTLWRYNEVAPAQVCEFAYSIQNHCAPGVIHGKMKHGKIKRNIIGPASD